jgi:hypothetical protein
MRITFMRVSKSYLRDTLWYGLDSPRLGGSRQTETGNLDMTTISRESTGPSSISRRRRVRALGVGGAVGAVLIPALRRNSPTR